MAGREKKPALLKKQMLASPSKEKEGNISLDSSSSKNSPVKSDAIKFEAVVAPESAVTVKQVKKPKTKKASAKKNLKINFKTKAKKTKKIKLSKTLFKSGKFNLDVKSFSLIKAPRKKRPRAVSATPVVQSTEDDLPPPVLEPMISAADENSPVKKEPKKRAKKGIQDDLLELSELCDKKKLTSAEDSYPNETVEDVIKDVANELQIDLEALIKKSPKKKLPKKTKPLIQKNEELKVKKRTPKKLKLEMNDNESIKTEMIDTLCKDINLDSAAQNVINNLDLNVTNSTKKETEKKRRHSIEKIPGVEETQNNSTFEQPFTLFSNTRRSASPRSKRNSKIRKSLETTIKKFSPYTTRSDSPARILRNGKHRKLKDSQLLDGLDSEYKKRKRLCSEYSGSEKCSEYLSESDSSFSDLASIQENGTLESESLAKDEHLIKSDLLKKEIVESINVQPSNSENDIQCLNIKQISTKFSAILKRSLSTETNQLKELNNEDIKPKLEMADVNVNSFIDTNSNDLKVSIKTEIDSIMERKNFQSIKTENEKCDDSEWKIEKVDEITEKIASSPSEKVPEKSLILDQMKQTFNDSNDETEKRATRSSRRHLKLDEMAPNKFYGNETPSENVPVNEDDSMETEINETQIKNLLQNESLDVKITLVNEDDDDVEENENEQVENDLLANLHDNKISISPINTASVYMEVNGSLENKENAEYECDKSNTAAIIEETPENLAIKENILSALGLQSLKAAEEAKRGKLKPQNKPDAYTGTLKTVIKLSRQTDKKKQQRNPLKMTLQKSKSRNLKDGDGEYSKSDGGHSKSDGENSCYKVMKEAGNSSGWRHGSHSSDTAGANRKSHYFNRSNMDGSSEQTSDGDVPCQEGESSGTKALVIPEKASSFSIHPDRLCSDECAYCFGKFGLFDTPLHIAQIKSVERQNKILENEIYLMRDSCLCDACYRHVDRRLNSSSTCSKNYKRNSNVITNNVPRGNNCHVFNCGRESSHVLRRKWLIKMKKSVSRVINIDLDNIGVHSIPVCSEHYAALEHLMVCALCKRRLARNHIHYLSFEWNTLNDALEKEGIPVKLIDKPVVCKLCRYFASLLLKPSNEIKNTGINFFKQYKKRLLHFHDIEVMDEAEAEEPISVPIKEKSEKEILKKQRKSKPKNSKSNTSETSTSNCSEEQIQNRENDKTDQSRVPSNSENGESRESTPNSDMVDFETLVPNMVLECASDSEDINKSEVPINKSIFKKIQLPESVREAVEISKIMKISNRKNNVVERLGSNPSISVRQLFPGEEELPLQCNIDFNNTCKERTPEGWEKCSCTIQYDVDTKHLWQELQKPYGNQSSFLRHLILLEKYFRNGDLTLSPNASHHAVNYSVSVQNRLRAYDNIPTNSLPMQPLTMLPFNQIKKSQSGIITTNTKDVIPSITSIINAANLPKNTPISISQLNPNILTQLSVRQKAPGGVPGLISLQPGTNRPAAPPLVKMPQKFKLPIGKNWRPTLIPVSQSKGVNGEGKRITGLVQVISNGKPYHISLQDYNRMCQIKKCQDLKQKTVKQEGASNSVLKPVVPRKQKPQSTATKAPETAAKTVLDKTPKEPNQSEAKIMILPKIPKSLTVIPQTVPRKPLQASSPTLSITAKPSTSKS